MAKKPTAKPETEADHVADTTTTATTETPQAEGGSTASNATESEKGPETSTEEADKPQLGQSDYFDGMAKGPMDFELATLKGDVRRALLDRIKQNRAPWLQLTYNEQNDIANGLDLYATQLIRRLVRILSNDASESTAVKLTDVQIKGSKGINGKINCENIELNRRLMMENCDQMVKIVFVDSDAFMGEREKEDLDPDQPELPIDGVNTDQEKKLAEAITAVVGEQRAATSFLQRKLGITYNKAAALMEKIEGLGIVTAPDDTGARTILANDVQKALAVAGLADAPEETEDPGPEESADSADPLPSEEKANAQLDQEATPLPKPTADLASPGDLELPPGVSAADV